MAEDIEKTPFEKIIERLFANGVEFIVIGGEAETLHGSPRVTYDTDICCRRTGENLRRLAEALQELSPTLRGAPPDLPSRLDAESLALGCNFTFATSEGDLYLTGFVEPVGDYAELVKHAETIPVGPVSLNVVALDDAIRVKEHLGRPKVREALLHLLGIRRIRDAES